MINETIAAISTAPGEAGIGIVRISGPHSIDIMRRMMPGCPDEVEPRHAYFGKVVRDSSDPHSDVIDEAVYIYMKGPHSYTGEDMLEIQAHGSNVSLNNIMNSVIESGFDHVRIAEKGEFTRLAFMNGKMDLSQAEAVIDIIKAKTDLSLGIAESQREGRLSENIKAIRSEILDILAQMAVNIDFPDEDEENTGYSDDNETVKNLLSVLDNINDLINTSKIGRIAKEGIRAVIAGKPNAGKSSLMNAVLGEGRAIVTDIPGTTRDTIEEISSAAGIPVIFTDTAGLRETDDKVEKIGIERTLDAINNSDIVIMVTDGSTGLEDEDYRLIDIIRGTDNKNIIAVINKEDLGISIDIEETIRERLPGAEIIITSLIGRGSLKAARRISEIIRDITNAGRIDVREMNIVSNQRHLKLLKNAASDIEDAVNMIRKGEPDEVAELSVNYAYKELGEIIGEEVGDDVLDAVFSRFCLGK